jgi:hypothetical protein
MRPCDIDTTGKVWLYRLPTHKTAHWGRDRVIAIGPKAQQVLKPLLPLSTTDYIFSPERAMAEYQQKRREQRVTPLTPSQKARKRKANPAKKPGICRSPSHPATAGSADTRRQSQLP